MVMIIAHAQANGAVGAVVQRRIAECTLPQIVVADTYDALWQLGKAARQRLAEPVVAVTGSSGKTSKTLFNRCPRRVCAAGQF